MAIERAISVARPDLFGVPVKDFTPDEYAQLPGGVIAQTLDYIVGGERRKQRDIIINIAGTAQSVGQFLDVYRTGFGQQGVVWNTGANFTKTEFHTSMAEDGKFPYSVTTVCLSFELMCVIYPAKAATVGSSQTVGQVTDAADNASQPTGYNPVATLRAMLFQNRFQFQRGAKKKEEEGLLWEIPQSAGISGAIGGATTANIVINATFSGQPVLLRSPKVIKANEDFYIRLIAMSALAQPVDFVAWFAIDAIEAGEEGRV